MLALEERHVLHNRVDRHFQLAEHADALFRVRHGENLRGRHNHRSRHRQLLTQRQLDISRARREVQNEVVQVSPHRVVEDLLHDGHHHRTAHDVRARGVRHPAEGHAEQIVQLEGQPGGLVVRQN